MSWLGRISQNRVQAQGPGGPHAPKGPAAKAVDAKAFAGTLISDKVLKRHGQSFAPATGDMQAIARAGQHLHTHRAAQFTNAVDQFYSALGRSTEHLDAKVQGPTVKASVAAMRQLVEAFGSHPALMPAMAALSSLLEPRGKVDVAVKGHAEAARATIAGLVQSLDGREGAGSLLFGFRNLVEAYESGIDGLLNSDRPQIWDQIQGYLDVAVPRAGCDQGELGRVAGYFHRALRQTPEDPVGALAQAKASALQVFAAPLEAAQAQIMQPAEHLEEGSPALKAHTLLTEALGGVLQHNPVGPAGLIDAVETLHGRLQDILPHAADEFSEPGFAAMARVIELSAQTPAAQTVLHHLAEHAEDLVVDEGARKVLQRAARVQKPESLAPVLLEAHMALMGQDPGQQDLAAALGKLKRLPAGPALNAAVTLMPHLQGEQAAPLAEALFVQARLAETPEALKDFAQRFVSAHEHLEHTLGADAPGVCTALARNGSGELDFDVIEDTGQLCVGVKNALPHTPLSKLLDRGKDGEPGLLQLGEKAAFIHDPESMLQDLLRAVAKKAGKKEAVPEARLAMAMAGQLAFFDREPRDTDFPKILEDFTAALKSPKALKAGLPAGAAAAVKGASSSLPAFAAAHPAVPIELTFTAGRALSGKQMTWLQSTLESSRSHAFGRALRDTVFAAVKMNRPDFIDALADPKVETKTLQATANYVAMEHRQNHADEVPFGRMIEGLEAGDNPVAVIEAEKAAKAMAGLNFDGVQAVSPEGMALVDKVKPQLQALLGFFNKNQYNKPPEHFLPHLQAVVKGHADGTWPNYKYSTEAAKEHLEGLTPDQIATWSQEMVTGGAAPVAADDPDSLEAMKLLRGVAKKMYRSVDLTKGRGFKDIGWNKASLNKLQKAQGELLDKLRNAHKGSKNHRMYSARIGPIQARVALLELHLTLKDVFRGEPGPSQAVLTRVQPLARSAMSALRKLGEHGFVDALDTAVAATKPAPANPKQGLYAADEDHLDAYLTSFDNGSCINPSSGFNRGGLVEMMAGSQYKMIRAVDGGVGKGRAFLRLVRVSLPNGYKGHAIAMDRPKGTPAGYPNGPETELMYEHALAKAVAMGVPLLTDGVKAEPAAAARGLKLKQMQCGVSIHKGITGMHHNEGLNGADYFISWPGVNATPRGYDVPEDDMKTADRSYSKQVVMPPNWK